MLSTTHPALWLEMHEQRVARVPVRLEASEESAAKIRPIRRNRLRSTVTPQLVGAEQR